MRKVENYHAVFSLKYGTMAMHHAVHAAKLINCVVNSVWEGLRFYSWPRGRAFVQC